MDRVVVVVVWGGREQSTHTHTTRPYTQRPHVNYETFKSNTYSYLNPGHCGTLASGPRPQK